MAVKRDKVLRDAEKLVQKGKLEQAIKEYEKVLKKFPDDTTTINRVGDLYGRIGQLKPAIKLYEEIAEHFTKDGFTTKAIAILKKIQRLDPQRLDVFERLAALYFEQGLVVEAKREYQILADWYVKNGDVQNAIKSPPGVSKTILHGRQIHITYCLRNRQRKDISLSSHWARELTSIGMAISPRKLGHTSISMQVWQRYKP